LVLVDNGSTDDTPQVLARELKRPENSFARALRVEKNIGYGHGLKAGLAQARARVAAFSHADQECPPEDVARALDIYKQNGPCLVKGRRRGPRPAADKIVTWFYNALTRLFLGFSADVNAQPKLFPGDFAARLAAAPDDFTFDLYVLNQARRAGLKIIEFDVVYGRRLYGRSKLAANPWVRMKTAARAFFKILALTLEKNP
jgi:glycosyltransferase involved in cell wall biosynthesis